MKYIDKFEGDTFAIYLTRYSDPERLNLARNAALYLGKQDLENIRRPLSIIRQGHVPEIFRGEQAEFVFEDVSKEVYDHLVTYTTRNMRVAGGNRALTSDDYTLPSDKVKYDTLVGAAVQDSMSNYKHLLEHGETPQVARAAMPIAAKLNKFAYQFNFLTLGQSVFKQRLWEKGAQGNTVKVVQGMWELIQKQDPDLWNTFYEAFGTPAVEWSEVRRKLQKKKITTFELMSVLSAEDESELAIDVLTELFGEQKTMW